MSDEESVWRSRALYLVIAVGVLAPLDVPLVGPVLPPLAEAFGVSNARAGLVVTVFAAPGVLFAPLLGWLADRYGRRTVLLPCLVIYGLAGVLVTTVDTFLAVLALRGVQGLFGGSIVASLALTLVGDLFEGARRNAAMGATTAAITVSAAVAPVLGGSLASVSWEVPFYLYGLSLVVAIAVFVGLPEPTAADESDARDVDADGTDDGAAGGDGDAPVDETVHEEDTLDHAEGGGLAYVREALVVVAWT